MLGKQLAYDVGTVIVIPYTLPIRVNGGMPSHSAHALPVECLAVEDLVHVPLVLGVLHADGVGRVGHAAVGVHVHGAIHGSTVMAAELLDGVTVARTVGGAAVVKDVAKCEVLEAAAIVVGRQVNLEGDIDLLAVHLINSTLKVDNGLLLVKGGLRDGGVVMVRKMGDGIVIGAGGGNLHSLAVHAGGKEVDCTLDQLELDVADPNTPKTATAEERKRTRKPLTML